MMIDNSDVDIDLLCDAEMCLIWGVITACWG